ncbi:MAG: TetR family transcriptional regulator C-terminal domain-containing protein [Actinobacteria bacterium]|nr:TetR family transcriptional regulator C-terminal domain-containing protein [Actinomycetota bacterium]
MVRTIDGERRRLDLADAVWRLIRRDGFEAASVRNVAAESGLSTGSVRHFFTTQSELQVFAMRALAERVRDRIAVAATEPAPRRRIAAMLAELLPLTDESAAEYAAWLPEVARETFDAVRQLVVRVLDGARELGLTRPDLDVPAAALALNALLDGLTFDAVAAPHLVSRADVRRALDTHLDTLLTVEV